MSKTNNLSSQISQGNPETWITAAEASSILHLSLRTVISRASSGKLPARIPNDAPFTCDGMQNYLIHLEALPQKAQLEYLRNHLPPSQSCGLDLTTPRSSNGDVWLYQFLDVARIIQDAANIRNMYQHTGKVVSKLRDLAEIHGISLSTLYRLCRKSSAKELSLLYLDPVYLQPHLPKTMCLWSADLSALKMHHASSCRIRHHGIRFQNTWYWGDELRQHIGGTADVFYHAVEKPLVPSSITVAVNGKFVCEAFPAERLPFTEAESVRLQSHLDGQQKHQCEMKQAITRINQSAAGILPPHATAAAMPEKAQLRNHCYAASVNETAPELSEDAATSSDNPKITTAPSAVSQNTSPADFQEMLRFLFGE